MAYYKKTPENEESKTTSAIQYAKRQSYFQRKQKDFKTSDTSEIRE